MNSEKHLNNGTKLFAEIFSEEIISNESFRSKLLAAIMGFLIVVVILVSFTYQDKFGSTSQFKVLIETTLIILAFILIRALVISRVAKKWNTYGIKTFIFIRYLNVFIEVSIPSAALILYSFYLPSVYPLFTPVSLLYFLIILLSALELDFKLCFFTGSLAAVQYSIIVWYLTSKTVENEIFDATSFYPAYLGIAALFFISGHTAGLITNQIKKGILKHYTVAQERNDIQKLFGQQISKEIVDHLVENKYEVQSRVRYVAILFLDIRNFSLFVESKSPEEIILYQNNVFSFMIDIVNKHKGVVNQIMGDGFMAIFGAPIKHENDCQLAVDAALEIVTSLEKKNINREIPQTRIGIGINAGMVVTGNVGTENRKQYSITGQPVIIAARLEQLNKKLNSIILVSKEVYNNSNIDESYKPEKHFANIKGQSELVEVYQII
jgi:adenylate cyclase